jgi:hypothetical protein
MGRRAGHLIQGSATIFCKLATEVLEGLGLGEDRLGSGKGTILSQADVMIRLINGETIK